ncbi:hypothetical protein [uncultured Bacteroides sp.]|uniref:hypothetical protein n=2 Tax=uncultured Bacteroides sp. TaxID=162156 RepID=UPI0025D4B328|nr:hypothetical protein [uncultured Bacteroides sp.]
MKYLGYIRLIVLILLLYLGWQITDRVLFGGDKDTSLEFVLSAAGNNRAELERVLSHYQTSPADSLKYKAARFLIENMLGNYGSTSQSLDAFAPLYKEYDSINRIYDFRATAKWGKKIDSLYKKYPNLLQTPSAAKDLSVVTSDYLIHEIDRSFEAWKRNVHSSKCSFEDFCEYILPYRRLNGLVADNARDIFYHRHVGGYYTRKGKHWLEETDSLLYEYKHLTHSNFWGVQIPVLNAGTFEYLRHGLCIHRCWYNSLLLSSLGMPVAIDFVPVWGNRNSSHTWNVLLLNGHSYAFESFWDNDRWKYKRIYNNCVSDSLWGKFRLPKVYRHTYSNHLEGPVADVNVDRDDIPALFQNVKKKDVSAEYFETHDVTVALTEPKPANARYAYLAVFSYQQWHPVQWGKINRDGTATFKNMGKDIVYLPVYYKNGVLSPAASPFKLEADGTIRILQDDGRKGNVCLRILTGVSLHGNNLKNMSLLCGSRFVGLTDGKADTELCRWTVPMEMKMNKRMLPALPAYRYIRMYLPTDVLMAGEIAFYTEKGRIPSVKVLSDIAPLSVTENAAMLTDGSEATTCRGVVSCRYVDFDLGDFYQLTAIGIYPYLQSQIHEDVNYTLKYWDGEWKVKETKRKASCDWLEFEDVPLNTLMMLKHSKWKAVPPERIFICGDEGICWQ